MYELNPIDARDDDFLLREGLDLLASYRAIRSDEARRSVMALIAAILQAEKDGKSLSISFELPRDRSDDR